ncbi:MAG TPA: PilZ domain-containing protein [Terracidiphilus sp.]|jgi:hypothetical protein
MMVEPNRSPQRSAKLRVVNPTEGTVVTPDVVQMDTASETFHTVAEKLKDIARGGIWLNPYRGIPKVSWMPELDLVYLDVHLQVLRSIEGYRQSTMNLPAMKAASALVLPSGRSSAARVQFGDQLELRDVATGTKLALGAAEADGSADRNGQRHKPEEHEHAKGLKGLWAQLFRTERDAPEVNPAERRRAERHEIPGTMAYFAMGSPRPCVVANISTEGFYVRTQDRWAAGTSLLVGLQITSPGSHGMEASISVQSRVVREGLDGIGFVYDDEPAHHNQRLGVANPEQFVQLQRFLQRIQRG